MDIKWRYSNILHYNIYETLEYDFKTEKSFSYQDLFTDKIIEYITEFTLIFGRFIPSQRKNQELQQSLL